jgi:hypothetical protein
LVSIGTFHGTPRHFDAGHYGILVGERMMTMQYRIERDDDFICNRLVKESMVEQPIRNMLLAIEGI